MCGDVTPRRFVNRYRRFGGSWRLFLQGQVDQVCEDETEGDMVLRNVRKDQSYIEYNNVSVYNTTVVTDTFVYSVYVKTLRDGKH